MSNTFASHPNRAIEKEIAKLEDLYEFFEERFWANKSVRIRDYYTRKMTALSYQIARLDDQLTAEDYDE